MNEWRKISIRTHKKAFCPKCRADIGNPDLWRSFPEEIFHLKKILRLEKIKFNFLKNRVKRLEKKMGIIDQINNDNSE